MKVKLGRICRKCGKRYIPTGKFQKVCEKCNMSSKNCKAYHAFQRKTKLKKLPLKN